MLSCPRLSQPFSLLSLPHAQTYESQVRSRSKSMGITSRPEPVPTTIAAFLEGSQTDFSAYVPRLTEAFNGDLSQLLRAAAKRQLNGLDLSQTVWRSLQVAATRVLARQQAGQHRQRTQALSNDPQVSHDCA